MFVESLNSDLEAATGAVSDSPLSDNPVFDNKERNDSRTSILGLRKKGRDKDRRGAVLVLMALLLVAVLAMVAFAIDIGMMVTLRTQIQNAVDAGALAANLKLRDDASAVAEAAEAARYYVQLNSVGMGGTVPEESINVEVGVWDSNTRIFTATSVAPNAVRVFAVKEDEPYFFGRIFGRTTFGAPATAVASGTGQLLDIMLVLDLSGSMMWEGRIQALWNSAPEFVSLIESFGGDDQIGVMGLATDPDLYDPIAEGHSGVEYNSGLHPTSDHYVGVLESTLTADFSYLNNTVLDSSNLSAGKYTGWTGTGAALGDAAHYLANGAESRDDVQRVIVLMSDGYANRPSGSGASYARTMATYAAGLDVKIYTISLGNGADLNLMQDIATIGGGEHFDATGSGEAALTEALTNAFREIAGALRRAHLVQ